VGLDEGAGVWDHTGWGSNECPAGGEREKEWRRLTAGSNKIVERNLNLDFKLAKIDLLQKWSS
jgi:hypothetical protein